MTRILLGVLLSSSTFYSTLLLAQEGDESFVPPPADEMTIPNTSRDESTLKVEDDGYWKKAGKPGEKEEPSRAKRKAKAPEPIEILCPTESDKKPELTYSQSARVAIIACGSVDSNRLPPRGKVWMTRLNVYSYKDDGSPTPMFENDSELRNFFVSIEKDGIRSDEVYVFEQKPVTVFSTTYKCDKVPCYTRERCVRPSNTASTKVSTSLLKDNSRISQAQEHLNQVFRAALSGSASARKIFKDIKLKNTLESSVRDQYEKYEEVMKKYTALGC